ncbi:MAG: Glu-tRNA(Gln) amidotransferase subunit GatD [Nanoarchaeota archaeon]|nr:Glu-tRNA(Gln) amidotransferase subunit GatD [DPANN group archaeon]MBL7116300.1 Glu-tRNA(Gln) amidotransferase subunit GatD [Nanoarchaeota archaeon]
MAKAGDKVKIFYKKEVVEGVLMPEEDPKFVFVKLDSGYNIGLKKSFVKRTEMVKKKVKSKQATKKVTTKRGLPTISILHTGGTIASKVDYETGAVIARYSPEEILSMFPELKQIANIKSRLVRNMWSEDMRFAHYNMLAKEVKKEINGGSNGVIITHGTDTLHYTSAALSFALENLPVPVILVGSQRSSDRGSSDAAVNLISAALFISTRKDFADVAVCMHENTDDDTCIILSGTKCRKMHSSRRDAFRAINTTPWTIINWKKRKIKIISTDYNKPSKNKLKILPFKENLKVGLMKVHTQMYSEQFKFYKGYAGLIIEGTGIAGNIPVNEIDDFTKENTKIAKAIQSLVKSGTVVAAATQTIYGRIDMNVYTTGRKMQDLGIIGNYLDMIPETAFIKLAWLLSNHKKKVKKLFMKNLRGEISNRTEKETYLV